MLLVVYKEPILKEVQPSRTRSPVFILRVSCTLIVLLYYVD